LRKSNRPEIPRKTVYRLSLYLRCLARLKDNNIQTVSSETLAKVAGVKPTQLRKDLTYFGQFGTRGLGYDVAALSQMISDELGTTSLQPVVLVGVGNLGLALLSYRGFEKEGFEIVAAFDVDPKRRRDKEIKCPILGMDELPKFIEGKNVKMAIVTVPAAAAQEVANTLVECGIVGILNFSPIVLHVPEEIMVNNVNVAIELENLTFTRGARRSTSSRSTSPAINVRAFAAPAAAPHRHASPRSAPRNNRVARAAVKASPEPIGFTAATEGGMVRQKV